MSARLDGSYVARYEGLSEDARFGLGVIFLKDGKMYGGDSLSALIGDFEDHGNVVTARVKIFGWRACITR